MSNFKISTIDISDILYHGTANILVGDIKPPFFLSPDPLQSIGHVIANTFNFRNNIEQLYNTCYKNKGYIKRNIFVKEANKFNINFLTKFIENNIPLLYEFKVTKPIKLLSIKESYNWLNSFNVLINFDILPNYIMPKYEIIFNELVKNINYLIKVKDDTYNNIIKENEELKKNIKSLDETSEQKIDTTGLINLKKHEIINALLTFINQKCKEACFAGYYDTIIYLILQNIDYNSYLKDINLLDEDDIIYVFINKPDQDAIILLDTSIIKINITHIIYPHNMINFKDIDLARSAKDILIAKQLIYDKMNHYTFEKINTNNKTYNEFLNDIYKALGILNNYYTALFYSNDKYKQWTYFGIKGVDDKKYKWSFTQINSIKEFDPHREPYVLRTLPTQVNKFYRVTLANEFLLGDKLKEYITFILSKNVENENLKKYSNYSVSTIRKTF